MPQASQPPAAGEGQVNGGDRDGQACIPEGASGIAAHRLRKAGYEVTAGVGKTRMVGLLRNGDGPTVMLRADMDALPIG